MSTVTLDRPTAVKIDQTYFFPGLAALDAAFDAWSHSRDAQLALVTFESRQAEAREDRHIMDEASHLSSLIPQGVLLAITHRTTQCWAKYLEMLGGQYLPKELDDATNSVKQCICRELRRIAELNNGVIPEGMLREWWEKYGCRF